MCVIQVSRTIVLDRNSALRAEALNSLLGNSFNHATNMIAQCLKINSSEVSGCGQGPCRNRNTVMGLEHSLLIMNNKRSIYKDCQKAYHAKGRFIRVFKTQSDRSASFLNFPLTRDLRLVRNFTVLYK